jgi:sortase (surface protein transpeptidase)
MNRWPAVPLAVAALAGLLASGCGGPARSPAAAASPRGGKATAASHRRPPGVAEFHSLRSYDRPALPVRLWIPKISVSTTLVKLGRLPDGSLQVPKAWDTAGWYDGGPRPGQPGPAVILGHVDSTSGPAVFYRLIALRPGDIIRVGLANRRILAFRVRRIARYPKDKFPTQAVYFPTLDRELRLITCGGSFDQAVRSYRDNVVVYATLIA